METMKEKIKKKIDEWMSRQTTCDPMPIMTNLWEVKVDNKTVEIIAMNRLTAYLKAKWKYPNAKSIRVIRKKSFFGLICDQ